MGKKPIRILQVVNIMDRAGIETMLMNYYRNVDKSKVQFDFLTHRPERGAYDDEIEAMGGKIYHAPRLYPQNYGKYFKYLKKFFQEHKEYNIIHSHIDAMSTFPLYVAKKNDIPVRIAHSHSSKIDKDYKWIIKQISKKVLLKQANYYFSCGEKAGRFLFGTKQDFKIINNAVDIDKFEYSSEKRKLVREKLGIKDDEFVLGHVGRYIYIKNQSFLIDVFSKVLEKNKNSRLLLIGKGPDENKLRKKVKEMKLEKKVSFLIDRADVNDIYQAMDVFVMPSIFEGLPVVAIEAQAAGLPCVFSSNISTEVLITANTKMINLKYGADKWASEIEKINYQNRKSNNEEITKKNFNIKIEALKLQNEYLKLN